MVDIYEPLQAEHSVKFFRYDTQTSRNAPLPSPLPCLHSGSVFQHERKRG